MTPVWLTDTVTPDLDRAISYTLLWGLEGVVLRTVGKHGERVPHVNEAKVKRRITEHGMSVAAIDPGLFEQPAASRGAWLNDLALLAEVATFACRIGCDYILVGGLPGDLGLAASALQRAGDVADRHRVTLAVQNEIGGRATAQALAELLAAIEHPRVRAAWNPAEALEAGEEAEEGIIALGDDIAFVSVRDGKTGPSGWTPQSLGDGAVGWARVIESLHSSGYAGPLSLDLRDLESAREGLGAASCLIRMTRQARRS